MREEIIQKVLDKKIVAIVRGVYGQDAVNLAKALYAGGIELLEVTFDQSKPESLNRTSDTVKMLCQELGDKMYFGAGTVTTGLNVREEPNADSAKVGEYKEGDQVVILEVSDTWGRTDKGWINLKYVRFS
jgi:2-dehydro-3-deoxyphosphogluconate aldolase/(4S)-4-hydroxy-2-oxoglutarate aldolase